MSYIGNEPIVSATRTVTEVTATAGQTVFNANGGYTVGYLDVFLNGSKLTTTDFTATNGSSITLTEAAQVGDIVRLDAWGTFSTSTAVLRAGDTMTGALLLPDGSASAPALSNDGDTNTGIFFPAADTIAFAEGGTESMRIDSSGNVGIGLTTGSSKLEVAGSNANNSGARATYEGTIKINEGGLSSLQATGGLEFKGSVFGSGYGSKITGTDNGQLLFGNRDNSASWTERMRIDSSGNITPGADATQNLGASGTRWANVYSANFVGNANASNSSINNAAGGLNSFQILGTGGAAMMTFHRPGAFACYFGLENDNQLRVGGWSYGGNSYVVHTDSNGGRCYSWVNFNGTGTVAIRASFNVSSITDNGTGNYRVNFTNALPDANYSVVAGAAKQDTNNDGNIKAQVNGFNNGASNANSTTGTTVMVGPSTVASTTDSGVVTVAVFR